MEIENDFSFLVQIYIYMYCKDLLQVVIEVWGLTSKPLTCRGNDNNENLQARYTQRIVWEGRI